MVFSVARHCHQHQGKEQKEVFQQMWLDLRSYKIKSTFVPICCHTNYIMKSSTNLEIWSKIFQPCTSWESKEWGNHIWNNLQTHQVIRNARKKNTESNVSPVRDVKHNKRNQKIDKINSNKILVSLFANDHKLSVFVVICCWIRNSPAIWRL